MNERGVRANLASMTDEQPKKGILPRFRLLFRIALFAGAELTGISIVNTAPALSMRLAAVIVPPIASNEAAADGQSQAGSGTLKIAIFYAVKFLEDQRELIFGDTRSFIDDLKPDHALLPLSTDCDGGRGRRIFRGVIEQIDEHLLHEQLVEFEERQIRLDSKR